MDLKPLSSVVIFSMVAMNNVAVGGPQFLFRGLGFKCIGFAMSFLLLDVTYEVGVTKDVLLCLPLIGIYPIVLGLSFYKLSAELKGSKALLKQLSNTDALTGLFNRRYWCEVVSMQMSRPKLIQCSALVIVDVDRFKLVNDIYGHVAGDKALCVLADILRARLRATDSICRFGGDEFCIFLTEISVQEVSARMTSVSEEFASEIERVFPKSLSTLSVGIMNWSPEISDVDAWLSLADQNLYDAKKSGRNKVVIDGFN